MNEIIDVLNDKIKKNTRAEQGDFYDKDGLLHCVKCMGKKQTKINIFGKTSVVWCICKCEQKRLKDEEEKRVAMERVIRLRSAGFPDVQMREKTFEKSDNSDIIQIAKNYVDNWDSMKKRNKGLLLFGQNSIGKTHAAACIVNALIDQGVPACITNFERLINELDSDYTQRQRVIDGLNNFKLLAIDDLGAERFDAKKRGAIFNIIDARVMSKLPLIITTNMTSEEMRHPKTLDNARIYERIFEACHPVEVKGQNRRRAQLRDEMQEIDNLLGINREVKQ